MYTIQRKEFNQLKKDLTLWLEEAFTRDNATDFYYNEGYINAENEAEFCYPINGITIQCSALLTEDGDIKSRYFNHIDVTTEDGEFANSQINDQQINELNNIIKDC